MGLREGSAGVAKAEAAGLRVMDPAEAARWADVVMVLTPDEGQGDLYRDKLGPNMKPGAALAFVHLQPGALVSSGDPADVFDGVCAVFERAERLGMPAVVNLSLGANSGSHDGNTLYDCALDALLAKPGRAIAAAAALCSATRAMVRP